MTPHHARLFENGQPPMSDYGLIGDTRTAALVSADGAIDWMCVPRFDGDPLFGRLVGGTQAGTFRIGPSERYRRKTRRYHPGSATLETTWTGEHGQLVLEEGMVAELGGRFLPATLLVRRLTAHGEAGEAVVEFDPRFGDCKRPTRVRRRGDVLVCEWGSLAVSVRANAPMLLEPGLPNQLTVTPKRPLTIVMAVADREPLVDVDPDAAWALLTEDQFRWQDWVGAMAPDLPHRTEVARSLLTLRLLTYSPSGAPVAAPTTSLPEDPGGSRNWDYRFAWPRDASIGIGAFLGAGKTEEARQFMAWLLHASRLDRPRLPVLLTLYGKHPPPERELRAWPGYAASTPVRVGNGAAEPASAGRLRLGARRRLAPHPIGKPALFGDLAGHAGVRGPGCAALDRTGRGYLGDTRRHRPPRAFQAHGLAGSRPGAAYR